MAEIDGGRSTAIADKLEGLDCLHRLKDCLQHGGGGESDSSRQVNAGWCSCAEATGKGGVERKSSYKTKIL